MAREIETDVVVVGGGGAGLTVAGTVAASNKRVRVLVVEQDFDEPCNSAIASNFIPAAGTRFQRAAGIEDNAQCFAADIMKKNGGRSDASIALALCEHSADAVHWLVDALAVNLEFAPELTWLGHSVIRMHAHPSRGGPPVLASLRDFAASCAQIKMLDHTTATGLIQSDDGTIVGITAMQGDEPLRIHARNVVLTTGGYNANSALLARHIPDMAQAPNIGAKTDRGDGIIWAQEAGATCALMSGYQGRDCISADGTRVTPPVLNEGGIAVNKTGKRFVNEQQDYSALASVYRQQPEQVAFFIWDQRIQTMVEDVFVMQQAMQRGGIFRASDTAQLAAQYGLPESELAETLARYNEGVACGVDEFSRTELTLPLAPPYYAARITGAIAHTQGGLVVDSACRVMRADGTLIPNLYAGGNTMAGLSGDGANGYLSGNGLMVAYTSGYIIGKHAAASFETE
ncbi:MAG: fumarate reductase flavoprotein subunit [Gammaproteobacteria bacterium]|jgi:fumarate reductase flavoprotein subunit